MNLKGTHFQLRNAGCGRVFEMVCHGKGLLEPGYCNTRSRSVLHALISQHILSNGMEFESQKLSLKLGDP